MVWLGSWLSGLFIVVTNGWMQHPVGYTEQHGSFVHHEPVGGVVFRVCAGAVRARRHGRAAGRGCIVAGIGAFYLLAQRDIAYGREFVRIGDVVAFVSSILVIFPTGDINGQSSHRLSADQAGRDGGAF